MNGSAAVGAICCQYGGKGYGETGGPGGGKRSGGFTLGGGGLPGGTPKGLLEKITEAIDTAVHGGDSSGTIGVRQTGSARLGYSGAQVIPFPMVNPFKPVMQTGAPVTALNRFPNRFTRTVESITSEPDDELSSFDGLSGLGDWSDLGPAPPIPTYSASAGGGTLRTILGAIQNTLPATIQAFRAAPQNIYGPYQSNAGYYPGSGYTEYPQGYQQGGAAADIGGRAGAAVGGVGDTLGGIVRDHPYLVLGGVAAAVLLFMNPPRRR